MAGSSDPTAKWVLQLYPNAKDCLGKDGHVGKPGLTWFLEMDDDRYHIMIIKRCSHCFMPVGGDEYANLDNTERYYKGLVPLPQDEN